MKMAGASNIIGSGPGSYVFICSDLPLHSLRFPDYRPHNGNYSLTWYSENAVQPDVTRGTLYARGSQQGWHEFESFGRQELYIWPSFMFCHRRSKGLSA